MHPLFKHFVGNTPDDFPISVQVFRHTVWLQSSSVGLGCTVNTKHCPAPDGVGAIQKKSVRDLAHGIESANLLERSIAMAAINSNINKPILRDKLKAVNAFDLMLNYAQNKNVAIIGGFPNIKKFKDKFSGKNLWVFELYPDEEYELPSEQIPQYLPSADITIITATTLINHTFLEISTYLNKNGMNMLVGPSAPFDPILFDYHINVIAGSLVTDPVMANAFLSQGAAYRETKGLEFLVWDRFTK